MCQTPLEYLFSLETLGIKLGLEHIRSLCGALGNPQERYRSVIVAGTNGKGSVAAMVETGLRAAGYRTARFTSPHLIRLEERFVLNGAPIERRALEKVAADIKRTIEQLRASGDLEACPTFFEATTALAFELFSRHHVEVAVLEVGLGGRLDATNIASPIAGVVTSIDLDHERLLGHTIREIAFEKAGIIKTGMMVVTGNQFPEAMQVLEETCRQRSAHLLRASDETTVRAELVDGRTRVDLRTPRQHYGDVTLALRGRHQIDNACAAVRLLEELAPAGLPVPYTAVRAAMEETVWPGRLDLVRRGSGAVLLDAAHNPAGATALAAYLREVYPLGVPMVFAALQDKNAARMIEVLRPCATHLVFTQPSTPRARSAHDLALLVARTHPPLAVEAEPSPEAAIARAQRHGSPVCVCGSIFLVGELLEALQRGGPAAA